MKRIRARAIIIHDQDILLMPRIKDGHEYYAFPGGGVESGETKEEAVLREVLEETTVKVCVLRLLYHHIYDDDTEQFFYLCRYMSGKPKLGSGPEFRRRKGFHNFYDPQWSPLISLPRLTVYPLEIRDWLSEDLKVGFRKTPRMAKVKITDLRRS